MPKRKTTLREEFDKHIDVVYGVSKTQQSHKIDFMTTSLRIEKAINDLKTAMDVLEYEQLNFGQIIQRDIDHDRVDKKIIGQYLEKGENRVIFFPPLVVAVVEVENGIPVAYYPQSTTGMIKDYKGWGQAVKKVWGDLFRLVFLTEEEETDWHFIVDDGNGTKNKHYFLNVNASLDYNSNKAQLIVVDGQHRLKALQKLYQKNSALIKDMNIPICIFFPSEATGEEDEIESVVTDMRELFVTINNEAQKVSGHFRVLLDDKKISCEVVRQLANEWKKATDGQKKTKSRLHLLEWNQRNDSKARQRTVSYSITTVQIITDILDKLFNQYGLELFLNLRSRQPELESLSENFDVESLSNHVFEPVHMTIITEQIESYLVPALDYLFRLPIPYNTVEVVLNQMLEEINKDVENSKHGALSFRKRFFEFREGHETYDDEDSIEIERKFKLKIKEKVGEGNQFYLSNVFQSGLLYCWGELVSIIVNEFNLHPTILTKAIVESLNEFCFREECKYFNADNPYTQDLLFDGLKINATEYCKNACKYLIGISFREENTRNKIIDIVREHIESVDSFSGIMDGFSKNCFNAYKDELFFRRREKMMKRWRFDESLPQEIKSKLLNANNKEKEKQICGDYLEEEINKDMSRIETKINKEIQ